MGMHETLRIAFTRSEVDHGFRELRVLGLLDVPNSGVALKFGVDELVDVAKLKFNRGLDAIITNNLRMVLNDL